MKLLNDICRCLDETCPAREHCLRWQHRENIPALTPYAQTLREQDEPADGFCRRAILDRPPQ